MVYLKSSKATDWGKPSLLSRLMQRLSANPDYEKAFPDVSEWLIEFGEDQLPGREIGLNSAGVPVLAGPNERNYGFWPDTNMKLSDFGNEVIDRALFEEKWNEFYSKNTQQGNQKMSAKSVGWTRCRSLFIALEFRAPE